MRQKVPAPKVARREGPHLSEAEMLRIEALLIHGPVDGLDVEARLLDPLIVHNIAHVVLRRVGKEHRHALVLAKLFSLMDR